MPKFGGNQNEFAKDIAEGLRAGRYRDCIHLYLANYEDRTFSTSCVERSLKEIAGECQCPDDCCFFKDKAKAEKDNAVAEVERAAAERNELWKRRGLWLPRQIGRFFVWYGKAPWQTQVFILIVVLSLLAPRFLPPVTDLIRAAIHGK